VGKRKKRPNAGSDSERLQMRWESIKQKCHPALFEMAELWKDLVTALRAAGPKPSKRVADELQAKFDERAIEIHNRYPDLSQIQDKEFAAYSIFSDAALTSESSLQGVSEWLYFERHKIPLKHDVELMQKGDWEASRRAQRTIADIERLRCNAGPILPFQGNLEHSNIFETTLGLGLEKLTQEELADYFDKYCPCGIEAHDPNALIKHRARFQKMLRDSGSSSEGGTP
jgi:hypothetical protein